MREHYDRSGRQTQFFVPSETEEIKEKTFIYLYMCGLVLLLHTKAEWLLFS